MISTLKQWAFRIPVLRNLAWKRVISQRVHDDATCCSMLLSAGHSLDHTLSRGIKPRRSVLVKSESLLKELRHREIPITTELLWPLSLVSLAKYGLEENYARGLEPSETSQEASGIDSERLSDSRLLDVLRERRSVRKWHETPVDLSVLRRLAEESIWAPCSCNRQSWKVLFVEDSEDKAFLTELYSASHNVFWKSAPVVTVIAMNRELYNNSDRHYMYLDAGAFIQNYLLLLHAAGLAGCWIGFIAWDGFKNLRVSREQQQLFHSRFGISTDYVPVSLIPCGYPARIPSPPPRKGIDTIVHDLQPRSGATRKPV